MKYTGELKNKLKYEDLSKYNYLNFRKVLLQGELLKFYIVLKIDGEKTQAARDILDGIFFKIEFETTDMRKESESGIKDEECEKTLSDLFTINSDKLHNKNEDYESVLSKEYNEENKTMIYEVYKQIIVPKNLLNSFLIMKVHLMIKNEISYSQEMNALDYYQNGYFETLEK